MEKENPKNTIKVSFYMNQHAYYNGEILFSEEFETEEKLNLFLQEQKKEYLELVYTIEK